VRSRGRSHDRFDIPVGATGGIQNLLERVNRTDRGFDAVICEVVDRRQRTPAWPSHHARQRLPAAGQ
jgi:hypothetical protein